MLDFFLSLIFLSALLVRCILFCALMIVFAPSFVQRIPLSVFWNAGLVVIDSFNLYLSQEVLISSSILKDNFAGYSNLSLQLFSFMAGNTSFHTLLAFRVSTKKSVLFWWVWLYKWYWHFSVAVFNILSFFCTLGSLTIIWHRGSFLVMSIWGSKCLSYLYVYTFSNIWEIFCYWLGFLCLRDKSQMW